MQIKSLKKKGFTLVELVIVVAVIAVLSAILIPTIGCFVEEAKETNDMATVRLLNAALVEYGAEYTAPKNMTEALEAMDRKGYQIEKLTPRSSGEILWDSLNNRFLLRNKEGKDVYRDNTGKATTDADLWKVVETEDKNGNLISDLQSVLDKDNYNHYLKGEKVNVALEVKTGIDVGNNKLIPQITYSDNAASKTIIRTNSAVTNLTINAPQAVVYHYELAGTVTIEAVASSSYHEFGSTSIIALKKGRVVVESGAFVSVLDPTVAATENDIACVNNGIIYTVKHEEGKTSITPTGNGQTNVSANSVINIGNAETLINLASASNSGASLEGMTLKLTADIDLSGKIWVPFGLSEANAFNGCTLFDGQNHTIKGLKTDGTTSITTDQSAGGTTIAPSGLIGYLKGDIEFKNLTVDVNISNTENGGIGAYIGAITNNANVKFENCNAKGSITGTDKLGGFIGSTYKSEGTNRVNNITMLNCTNYVNVTSVGNVKSSRIGGFIGTFNCGKGIFTDCKNEGFIKNGATISGDSRDCVAGGFAGKMNVDIDLTVTDFVNNGNMSCTAYSSNVHKWIAGGNNLPANGTVNATFNGKHMKADTSNSCLIEYID